MPMPKCPRPINKNWTDQAACGMGGGGGGQKNKGGSREIF